MFLPAIYGICMMLRVMSAFETMRSSTGAKLNATSPLKLNLSQAGLFRAHLTSANLDVAASNSHPRTSYAEHLQHWPASLPTEAGPYPFQSYPQRQDVPASVSFNYNHSSLADDIPLLLRPRLTSTFSDNAAPIEDLSIYGYQFDKGLSDGLSAVKQLHHTGYHYDKSFPTDQYGTAYHDRAYEKPALSASRLLYGEPAGVGDTGLHDMPVGHVPMLWEPVSLVRQLTPVYEFSGELHDTHLHPSYAPATASTQHKTKWQKKSTGVKKSSNLFDYDDVLAAYHHGTGTGKAAYPAQSISPIEYNLSPAASISYDQAMSVYHSKDTVPYNRQDYQKYPYGYSGSGSGLSSRTFAQTPALPASSSTFLDGPSNEPVFIDPSSTLRGFSGSQPRPGPGSRPGDHFDYTDVSSSASAPVQGFYTKQHHLSGPRNSNPASAGQQPHKKNPARSRPTPGFSSFFTSPSSSPLDGSTGNGALMSPHHLHRYDGIGQPQSTSRRSNGLNLLAPILRNYLMRGDASYERLDYDKETAYRHAPFLAAFFS